MKKDDPMRHVPEPSEKRGILVEQWWVGFFLLLAWGALIMAGFFGCAKAGEATISWDLPNPDEKVIRWQVFRGIEQLANVNTNRATVTLPDDAPSTLAVYAENQYGDHSPPALITVISIVVQESTDLKAWTNLRVLFRERQTAAFYRFKIITP